MTVEGWLLDSDPAIRWQVMRDLTDEPADAGALPPLDWDIQRWCGSGFYPYK